MPRREGDEHETENRGSDAENHASTLGRAKAPEMRQRSPRSTSRTIAHVLSVHGAWPQYSASVCAPLTPWTGVQPFAHTEAVRISLALALAAALVAVAPGTASEQTRVKSY